MTVGNLERKKTNIPQKIESLKSVENGDQKNKKEKEAKKDHRNPRKRESFNSRFDVMYLTG